VFSDHSSKEENLPLKKVPFLTDVGVTRKTLNSMCAYGSTAEKVLVVVDARGLSGRAAIWTSGLVRSWTFRIAGRNLNCWADLEGHEGSCMEPLGRLMK